MTAAAGFDSRHGRTDGMDDGRASGGADGGAGGDGRNVSKGRSIGLEVDTLLRQFELVVFDLGIPLDDFNHAHCHGLIPSKVSGSDLDSVEAVEIFREGVDFQAVGILQALPGLVGVGLAESFRDIKVGCIILIAIPVQERHLGVMEFFELVGENIHFDLDITATGVIRNVDKALIPESFSSIRIRVHRLLHRRESSISIFETARNAGRLIIDQDIHLLLISLITARVFSVGGDHTIEAGSIRRKGSINQCFITIIDNLGLTLNAFDGLRPRGEPSVTALALCGSNCNLRSPIVFSAVIDHLITIIVNRITAVSSCGTTDG
jgi:hypothetical protein